jgi:hypothetical protein
MRRAITSLLLALLFSQTAMLFVATAGESDLPVCCRRLGKHHCSYAEPSSEGQSSGPSFKGLQTKCPMYPTGVTPSVGSKFVPALASTGKTAIDLSGEQLLAAQSLQHVSTAVFDSAQKRGPPPAA